TLLEWDGTSWTTIDTGTTADFNSIDGTVNRVVAVTESSSVWIRESGTWTSVTSPSPRFDDVYVANSSTLYAVDSIPSTQGSALFRYQGQAGSGTWTESTAEQLDSVECEFVDGIGGTVFVSFGQIIGTGVFNFLGLTYSTTTVTPTPLLDLGVFNGNAVGPVLYPNRPVLLGFFGPTENNPFAATRIAVVGTRIVGTSSQGVVSQYTDDWELVVDTGRTVSSVGFADECSAVLVGPGGVAVHQ
ncbi:MAG: hypothetical protein AAFQ82_21920, partial [Myxococcota bacterium]